MHDARYHERQAALQRAIAEASTDAAASALHRKLAADHAEKAWAIYFLNRP